MTSPQRLVSSDWKYPALQVGSKTTYLPTIEESPAMKSGKGKMPAGHDKLTEGQIKNLVTYIQTMQKK